jgi:hypothetical protein
VPVTPPAGVEEVAVSLSINGQTNEELGIRDGESALQTPNSQPLIPHLYRFSVPPQPEGITTLQVAADFGAGQASTPDPLPANNSAFASIQVFPAPSVLFVSSQPASAQAGRFVEMLAQNNLQVEMIGPGQIPTDLQSLETFRVIFLHDLLSSQISQEQMLALEVFVSRLAGGLVFYRRAKQLHSRGTQAPVRADAAGEAGAPSRSERPPIVFLLVLDRSASMGTTSGRGPRPIDSGAGGHAGDRSHAAAITWCSRSTTIIPGCDAAPVGQRPDLREALDSQPGELPAAHACTALLEALAGMQNLPAEARLPGTCWCFRMGRVTMAGPLSFQDLAEAAQAQGITLRRSPLERRRTPRR